MFPTKNSLRQDAGAWLAMACGVAAAVSLIEFAIRGHAEAVHVLGASISTATAVLLGSRLDARMPKPVSKDS
jgi:hypothetical protein